MRRIPNAVMLAVLLTVADLAAGGAPGGELHPFKQNDLYGYRDSAGNVVIPPRFSQATAFSDGVAKVQLGRGRKTAFIDRTGAYVISPRSFVPPGWAGTPVMVAVHNFSDGRAWVRIEKRCLFPIPYGTRKGVTYGCIDKTGEYVTPAIYSAVRPFCGGLAAVSVGKDGMGKWGFLDKSGAWAVSPGFDVVSDLLQERAWGISGDTIAAFDRFGRPVKPVLPSDINTRVTRDGSSLLHLVAEAGSLSLASELISKGAAVDSRDNVGASPLFTAVASRHLPIVELLIAKGADVTLRTKENCPVLIYAGGTKDPTDAAIRAVLLERLGEVEKDKNIPIPRSYVE